MNADCESRMLNEAGFLDSPALSLPREPLRPVTRPCPKQGRTESLENPLHSSSAKRKLSAIVQVECLPPLHG